VQLKLLRLLIGILAVFHGDVSANESTDYFVLLVLANVIIEC